MNIQFPEEVLVMHTDMLWVYSFTVHAHTHKHRVGSDPEVMSKLLQR